MFFSSCSVVSSRCVILVYVAYVWPTNAWFPALRFRSSINVKPCPYCRSVNAVAVSRHIGELPSWPSGLAGEFPALPSERSSRPRRNGNREHRTRSYKNGLTATANLRKRRTLFFYVSYRILTDECNSYVLLQQSTEIPLRINGNVMLETRCKLASFCINFTA